MTKYKSTEDTRRKDRGYYKCNIDKKRAQKRAFYQRHKDRLNRESKERRERDPIKTRYINKAGDACRKLKDADMTFERVQLVYEDNIKKYGTLTCVVCGNKITFGDDSLEHNIPLSKGGTHRYDNLGVAHVSCNSKKKQKSLEEYAKFCA